MTTHPIILIDGSSYLYRAFFATPPLTNAKGEPTGAIYGVTNMIRSLMNEYHPKEIAVIFDAKGGSFRNELFSEYKATRESMPEDLRKQIDPIHTILKEMGLPLLCVEGVEADDVIGTLAKKADALNRAVLVSTGDKDMAQLVTPNVTLINTMNNTVLTPESVPEKFGVPPHKIIDFLALMGDSSDNIPGVPGVGEKSAVALLSHFDGIDDIYNRIDEVETLSVRGAKSIKKKLIDNEELARLSYQLATIKTDVELDTDIDQLQLNPPNVEALLELFEEKGFNRWIEELKKGQFLKTKALTDPKVMEKISEHVEEVIAVEQKEKEYETILTESQLKDWVKKLSECNCFAFDTETNSLDHFHAEIVGISFSIEPHKACYIPIHHYYLGVPEQLSLDVIIEQLKPIFENPNIKKIGQNIKYDLSILANCGIKVEGVAFDTMLESYVLNSSDRHDMDSLALKYLNHKTTSYDELTKIEKKRVTIDKIEVEKVSHYACEDADITLQLHQQLYPKLEESPKLKDLFNDIELPLAVILSNMERMGVLVDEQQLKSQSLELEKRLLDLEEQIHSRVGEKFNINSPKQLQTILFEKGGLPIIKKTPKGEPSTNEEVLLELAKSYELPKLIIDYRGLAKLKNTYTDKLPLMISPQDNRIHTNYNQVGTITGRLSSNDPNLQNIPVRNEEGRKIREAFIAPKGYKIVSADYSQIELRIMAHLSKDENLLSAFHHDKDIHRVTAAEILDKPESEVTSEERRRAKAVNFGLIYGMSAFGLAKQIDISRNEAQFYIDKYFERYPGVLHYMTEIRDIAATKGYVETLSGRRLYLPKIKSSAPC